MPVSRLYLERHPNADQRPRYCYNGPAFRFRPQGDDQAHPREFRQAGIECFGEADTESADVEIVLLAVEAVRRAGLKDFRLRFGDIALFYALLDALALPERWRLKLRHHFWRPPVFHALLARLAKGERPNGHGAEAPDHGRQPVAMTTVLWVLAVPSLALGGSPTAGCPTGSTATTSPRPSPPPSSAPGVALVGGLVTYGAWRHTTALAARVPLGAVAAHPDADAGLVEAEAIATHTPVYGDIAGAPDPADPGRLLLGPLHRHAAVGFHLDALYTALFVRPVRAAATLVRFLDREVVDTYVRGAGAVPRLLGAAVRRAQTGNVQTYLERAARRLRRPGGRRRPRRRGSVSRRDRYQRVRDAVPSRVRRRRARCSAPSPPCCRPRPG